MRERALEKLAAEIEEIRERLKELRLSVQSRVGAAEYHLDRAAELLREEAEEMRKRWEVCDAE